LRTKLRKLTIIGSLAAFAVVTVPALSATKPKPKAKPSTTNKATLGTTQLAGENAKLGVTYTLGKANPINITLDKVEYTLEPVLFGKVPIWPKKNEKIMLVHYTLHNPNHRDFGLAWSTLDINAVDSNDKNWRYVQDLAVETTHDKAYMSLKPAQKTRVYTCILVPAEGQIPKLMFQSSDKLVLRYDLRGKATPLPATIADPSDTSGATCLEKITATMGEYYPMMGLHCKVESAAFSTSVISGRAPKKGWRYLVVTGTAKNNMPAGCRFVWSTFRPEVTDVDGGEVHWTGEALFAGRDDKINADMDPNQEMHFRYVFEIQQNVQPKSLSMSQGGSHEYIYDLSQVK
jgi:hypothetical protein